MRELSRFDLRCRDPATCPDEIWFRVRSMKLADPALPLPAPPSRQLDGISAQAAEHTSDAPSRGVSAGSTARKWSHGTVLTRGTARAGIDVPPLLASVSRPKS